MAPSIVLSTSAYRSGVSGSPGLDLVLASAAVGLVHAVIAWSRLREETRTAARRLDVWIASFDALVVLAVGVTLLMITVLESFAGEHAILINEGWPVLALWLGVLLWRSACPSSPGGCCSGGSSERPTWPGRESPASTRQPWGACRGRWRRRRTEGPERWLGRRSDPTCHPGAWHTASTLLPSGSLTKAP
jgi:hypothetical protein